MLSKQITYYPYPTILSEYENIYWMLVGNLNVVHRKYLLVLKELIQYTKLVTGQQHVSQIKNVPWISIYWLRIKLLYEYKMVSGCYHDIKCFPNAKLLTKY